MYRLIPYENKEHKIEINKIRNEIDIRNLARLIKSIDEISNEIKRSPQYLKGEIIPVMIERGLLEREHIMPNHPAQRYKRTQQ